MAPLPITQMPFLMETSLHLVKDALAWAAGDEFPRVVRLSEAEVLAGEGLPLAPVL